MTKNGYRVEREQEGDEGRYAIVLEAGAVAEMTFTKSHDGPMTVLHTGVPSQFEGRGIAGTLLNALLDDARTSGFKIIPECPYVAAQFERHPEWGDLLAH